MAFEPTRRGRAVGVTAGLAAAALVLAGCSGSTAEEPGAAPLTIGTTDKVTTLYPAG